MATLFPPIISSSLPAFDNDLKVNFNLSIANMRSEIKHIQVIIKELNNTSILTDTVGEGDAQRFLYPQNTYFVFNEEIMSMETGGYYFTIPYSVFVNEKKDLRDNYYKIQIRFGPQDFTDKADKFSKEFFDEANTLLNNVDERKNFSEWSTIATIKPIHTPTFGLDNFDVVVTNPALELKNYINTTSFMFKGFFTPFQTTNKNAIEVLKSFKLKIFNKTTNTLLEDSGYIKMEMHNQNIEYTSTLFFENNVLYTLELYVVTKDGYEGIISYTALGFYNNVVASSTLRLTSNEDLALNTITIQGRTLRFRPIDGTVLTDVAICPYDFHQKFPDGPFFPEGINTTHVNINGSIKQNEIEFIGEFGKWTMQFRAYGFTPYSDEVTAFKNENGFLTLEQLYSVENSDLRQKIKLSAVNYSYGAEYGEGDFNNINAFIIRKELYDYSKPTSPTLIYAQNYFSTPKNSSKNPTTLAINANTEYYFFIKENQGLLYLYVEESKVNINNHLVTK